MADIVLIDEKSYHSSISDDKVTILTIQAYMITLKEKEMHGRTNFTKSQIRRISKVTGIKNLEIIYGDYDSRYGDVPQIGLSLAHMKIWDDIVDQRLSGAWVFEDDVLFHDDFDSLFPMYWAKVPLDYEVIWVGHLMMGGNEEICEQTNENNDLIVNGRVFCTHAMVISRKGAERLSRAMAGIIDMSIRSNRSLSVNEIKIDLFLDYIRLNFVPKDELRKWLVFGSTRQFPSKWGGVSWCRNPDLFDILKLKEMKCETADVKLLSRLANASVPIMGSGLAFQNLCRENHEAIERWRVD